MQVVLLHARRHKLIIADLDAFRQSPTSGVVAGTVSSTVAQGRARRRQGHRSRREESISRLLTADLHSTRGRRIDTRESAATCGWVPTVSVPASARSRGTSTARRLFLARREVVVERAAMDSCASTSTGASLRAGPDCYQLVLRRVYGLPRCGDSNHRRARHRCSPDSPLTPVGVEHPEGEHWGEVERPRVSAAGVVDRRPESEDRTEHEDIPERRRQPGHGEGPGAGSEHVPKPERCTEVGSSSVHRRSQPQPLGMDSPRWPAGGPWAPGRRQRGRRVETGRRHPSLTGPGRGPRGGG